MTAEQLEELAGGRNPSFMGLDCAEAITSLARRVIAAEKLANRLDVVLDDMISPLYALRAARTAYREASK